MGSIFTSKNVESFFEIMQRPVKSRPELIACVREAIDCIAEELHVGKVIANLSIPQSRLRAQIDNFSYVLYQTENAETGQSVPLNFRTGDGGTVVFTFFTTEGHSWTEDELAGIRIVGKQIFAGFSQVTMGDLLKHAMLTDLSVGIPNTSGFMERAGKMYEQGKLDQYCAIYLNIGNFKYVNKVLNHLQADEVMKLYANNLVKVLGEDENVGRLGGDNFIVLVRKENVPKFLEFISNVDITYRYENGERIFHFGATIGVAELFGLKNLGDMMFRSGMAYQVARQHEGIGVVYFDDDICKQYMAEKETVARFHRAFNNGEFIVYYQPKVTTSDRKICGAEAVVRWNAQGKILPPSQFVPVLEKEGSICKLDFYVLDKVCALLHRCREEGVPLTKISVNFSRRHIDNQNLTEEIVKVIDKYQIPHEYLEIELTESEDFRDYVVMSRLNDALKQEGISTSIDDFGTGYSSLNMLKRTKVDVLKIDRSFVPLEEDYEDKEKDIIMFENIARMAKELGIKIIAEGVETQQQYEYLVEAGCDMIQGHYFDMALPEDEFLKKIQIGHY